MQTLLIIFTMRKLEISCNGTLPEFCTQELNRRAIIKDPEKYFEILVIPLISQFLEIVRNVNIGVKMRGYCFLKVIIFRKFSKLGHFQ